MLTSTRANIAATLDEKVAAMSVAAARVVPDVEERRLALTCLGALAHTDEQRQIIAGVLAKVIQQQREERAQC